MNFHEKFAEIQLFKVELNIPDRAFMMNFYQKCALMSQNRFLEGWGGLGRLFGLPWGFTPNQWGSPQKIISDQAHPIPYQIELSKMQILALF